MEDYRFQRAAFRDLESLRQQQALDLKGQVHDPLEERIELVEPVSLTIRLACRDVGYALVDGTAETKNTLLEFYVVPRHRSDAKAVLDELILSFHCDCWLVNTQDSFSFHFCSTVGFRTNWMATYFRWMRSTVEMEPTLQ